MSRYVVLARCICAAVLLSTVRHSLARHTVLVMEPEITRRTLATSPSIPSSTVTVLSPSPALAPPVSRPDDRLADIFALSRNSADVRHQFDHLGTLVQDWKTILDPL